MMQAIQRKNRALNLRKVGLNFLVLLVVVLSIFPFLWMVATSLKTRIDTINPGVWFFSPTWQSFKTVIEKRNLWMYLSNSLVTVFSTTVISLVLSIPAAYGLARFKFRRKEDLAFWILSLRMLPPMAVVIPFFLLGRFVGLLDTNILLIIVYLSFNIPFAIWMLRGFIEEIPIELEEAAWVDGCTLLQGLRTVVMPLIWPGLAATSVFIVIQSWNEFVLALFLTSFNARTVPTMVTMFLSVSGIVWGEMAAVGVITTLPVLVFTLLAQKYLIRGLTFGAIKS
jgi:multiple sugar transport system permease protein